MTLLISPTEKKLSKIALQEREAIVKLQSLLGSLSSHSGLEMRNLLVLLDKRMSYAVIPVELFKMPLSPLQAVVYYLSTEYHLGQTEIAHFLNRDHTTIWTSLQQAKKKMVF